MDFSKAYNRQEFVNFLQNSFLPEDFIPTEESVEFRTKMTYTRQALKLGTSAALDLVVYEVRHNSKNDARVSLSKEAFRLLADEMEDRALVVFVPEDNNDNYRFSLIEITLEAKNESSRVTRNYSNPRRYSYFLGKGIAYYTPNKYLNEKGRVVDSDDLRSRFSVEVLTKEFYQELSDWYAWAIKIIRFPNDLNDKTDDDKFNNESAIRLITRLIFVWFLKQHHLIPEEFFDEAYLSEKLLKNFKPYQMGGLLHDVGEVKYYKAILQNLFFAMLNSPITPEGSKEMSERHFRNGRGDYDNNKLMRYESYFKNPQLFVDLANRTVPFLNGGLFDCLDDKDNDLYYDGFSDREAVKKSLIVPDYLFFGEEAGKNIDLSEWYGSKKKKKVSARGIIDILKRYNFTVEENTPFDKEVSLDPELLGKVFENLLASYNPETQTTARKQTGSFYTPREIVQYMVDESLVAHLKRTVGDDLEQQYRQLMQYTDEDVSLTDYQRRQIMLSLYNCKVLDPACGSGAFPMGILQQMVHILSRIDPDNKMWKEIMLQKAIDETSEAYRNSSNEERKELIADIERSFDESINRPDYARKLYLIENCIYGVDIQPIAIQISKLRFFISLVVDQNTNTDPTDNFGIRPLPNLEAKFVAANTLVGLNKKDASLFDSKEIKAKENELKIAKHKIFGAKTVRTKRKYKKIVNELRQKIANMLENSGAVGNNEARQLASWDMFNQNDSSKFFDSEWMFGVKDGFDIVIGNPPYINVKNQDLYTRQILSNLLYSKGADVYVGFIEKGYDFLSIGAVLCLIVPNKFFGAGYGKKIRFFIQKNKQIDRVWDIKDVNVFENAAISTIVFISHNKKPSYPTLILAKGKLTECNVFDSNGKIQIESSDSEKKFLTIINNNSFELGKLADVRTGIMGFEYWKMQDIINTGGLCSNDEIPIYTNGNLSRYLDKWNETEITLYKDKYYRPTIKLDTNYLNTNTISLFKSAPKIIVRGVARKVSGIITEQSSGLLVAVHAIIPRKIDIYALLAYINSKFINWYHLKTFYSQRIPQGSLKYPVEFFQHLPIPYNYVKFEKELNSLAKLMSKSLNKEIDNKIDYVIYKSYGLNYDEVLIVDPQTSITREEYEDKID